MKTFRYPIFCSQRFLYQLLLLICICRVQNTKAQSWQSLGGGASFSVYALAVDSVRDELYVGGWFDRVGNTYVNGIAKWDGQNWQVLNSGVNAGGSVNTILIYNNEVYVGGSFDSIGGIAANNIARWDHTSWYPMGSGFNGTVYTITNHQGEIYAGGDFSYSGTDTVNFIGKWNGSYWINHGNGLNDAIWASISFNNELIVGGENTPMRWNGNAWNIFGTYLGSVFKFKVINNKLYVGGRFRRNSAPLIRYISQWDNNDWQIVPQPFVGSSLDPNVSDMVEYNGKLVITGGFKIPLNIAIYNGSMIDSLREGLSSYGIALDVFRGDLIAGGIFNYAGDHVPNTNNLARWVLNSGNSESQNLSFSFYIKANNTTQEIRLPIQYKEKHFNILLYDITGRAISKLENSESSILNVGFLIPGLYVLKAKSFHNDLFSVKILMP